MAMKKTKSAVTQAAAMAADAKLDEGKTVRTTVIPEVEKAPVGKKLEAAPEKKPQVASEKKAEPAPEKKPQAAAEKKAEMVAEKKGTPAAKKEPKVTVAIEYGGKQVMAKDLVAEATKAFAKANKGVEVKTVEIYAKPEENVAYYVVNGKGTSEDKVSLFK